METYKVSPDAIETWNEIISEVKKQRPGLAASLRLALPLKLTQQLLTLGFHPDATFSLSQLEDAEKIDVIRNAIFTVTGFKSDIYVCKYEDNQKKETLHHHLLQTPTKLKPKNVENGDNITFSVDIPKEDFIEMHAELQNLFNSYDSTFPGLNKLKKFFDRVLKIDKMESPIEKMFWEKAFPIFSGLTPQVEIGKYRVDFAISSLKIAIEIDGHEYHKTKEQRTHDAQRERYLQVKGWTVIRFTGSEIFTNLSQCIQDLKEITRYDIITEETQ